LAHFFAHYLEPRRRAAIRFGLQILPVVDGERLATSAEKLAGVLHEVPIGPFEDFLARDDDGRPWEAILGIEEEADLIALELLAPYGEVLRLAKLGPALPWRSTERISWSSAANSALFPVRHVSQPIAPLNIYRRSKEGR
jgi:hypothetical protein